MQADSPQASFGHQGRGGPQPPLRRAVRARVLTEVFMVRERFRRGRLSRDGRGLKRLTII